MEATAGERLLGGRVSTETALQRRSSTSLQEKAHEDAVKQYIDFALFLLQVLSNKRRRRLALNRASPCQINIAPGSNKRGQIILLSAPG